MLYKFQEAVFFSSWGFFLLASPMMIAYGIVVGAPWYYYCLILPLIIAFVYIPSGVGALVLPVHHLPAAEDAGADRRRGGARWSTAIAGWSIWRTVSGPQTRLFGSQWFQETLLRFRFTQQEWLPSSWLTGGLLEAARPEAVAESHDDVFHVPFFQSCLYLALLISNAMMCHVLTVWAAKRWFRAGYNGFVCGPRRTRHPDKSPSIARSCDSLAFADRVPAALANWSDRSATAARRVSRSVAAAAC